MEFFRRTRGSVTIFLVIILVPVLVISGLFVDVSRMRLAQAMASSAGDLALNTIMTQYDVELNDYYGMMASAQNIDEFLGASEKYFEACMVSGGVETTYAKDFAKQLIEMLKGEEVINDVMDVDLENTTVTVNGIENGNLANPSLVKQQIVEFMKYRAPIEGIASFLDSMKGIGKAVDIKPVETEETAQKEEYYKAENELMEKALEVYKAILEYQKLGVNEDYIKALKKRMDDLYEEYEQLHKDLVFNWYNSDHCQGKVFESLSMRVNSGVTYSGYKENTPIGTVGSCFSKFENAASSFISARDNLMGKIEAVTLERTYHPSMYDIQYWVQWAKILNEDKAFDKFVDAANSFFMAYAKMENAYANRAPLKKWEKVGTKIVLGVEMDDYDWVVYDYADEDYKDGKTYDEYHSDLVSKYTEFSSLPWELVNMTAKMYEISNASGNLDKISHEKASERLAEIANELKNYQTKLNNAYVQLSTIRTEAAKLIQLASKYQKEFDEWYGVTNGLSSDQKDASALLTGDADEAETVKKSMSQSNSPSQSITVANVNEFCSRVDGMMTLINSYKTAIESYRYCGKPVIEISEYNAMKNLPGISESSITLFNTDLETYAKNRFVFEVALDSERPEMTNANSPDFNEPNKDYIQLWSWMQKKFGIIKPDDEKKAREQYDALKNLGKKEIDESNKDDDPSGVKDISKTEIKDMTDLPSAGTGETGDAADKSSDSSVVNGIVQKIFGGFNFSSLEAFADSMRDNLYCTMYIMEMFSYDTFNLEGRYNIVTKGSGGKYKVASDYGGGDLTLFNYNSIYKKADSIWTDKQTTFYDNKTLTNKLLANGEQYSFGNEVEYILYGGKNSTNKLKSYGSIYAMRYAFDLCQVYNTYYNHASVEGIAAAISGATYGVIPVPLIKMVIVLGINAAEAATDLMYLKKGMPVILFKSDEKHLFLSFTPDLDSRSVKPGSSNMITEEHGLYWSYSDYLFMFTFLSLMSDYKADDVYKRVADVMQCNMGKVLSDSSYKLANSYVYYKISADVRVKPLLTATPLSRSEGTSVLDTSSWNKFTYSAIRGY